MDHTYSTAPPEVAGAANLVANSESMSRQEAMERFSSMESSLDRILRVISSLQQGPQTSPGDAAQAMVPPQTGHLSQGNLSDNYVSVHPATAPTFIKVASHPLPSSLQTEVVSTLPQADTQVSPQLLGVAVPQSTMGGAQATHVAVSSTLPPVPGYLVDRIKLGHFVDFTLLRPLWGILQRA